MLLDAKIPKKIAILETTYAALRYSVVAPLEMELAETLEHYRGVPPAKAGLEWRKVTAGDRWGDSWMTAWLRGNVEVPIALDGQPVFLRAATGAGECMLLIDGTHRGVFDVNHPVRLLALQAVGGAVHEIHLEAYSGHTFPGTQPFDEPLVVAGGAPQDSGIAIGKGARTFDKVELVTERADVSAFLFELRALRQLSEALDESSLRRGKILAAMQQVFTAVYAKPEVVEEDVWRAGLAEARRVMRPLLEMKNGPTTPKFGIIGHSHIDTAWLWPIAETHRKLARTFSSILSLMDQYPDFKFTSSAAYHADVVRELYPEIFSRIQQRVKEGRWEINGAMWIEPDCNIPSGESFVRQCLVGQRATREMFGVTSDTLWQPDVFGYSAALPQILRGSGVEFFCTTKLGWNDTNHFPYDTFVWKGMDGSSVLSHFNLIHCWPDPETLIRAWKEVQHNDVQDRRLLTFGYGDGGGGPMAEMIEMGRLSQDLEGSPRAEYQSISEFMTGVRDEISNLPTWTGELYLELHRGTLTSIAPIKRGNRKCEFALRDAELAATIAALKYGAAYPASELLAQWKKVLLNQFHDILPGSSIARVNDEAITLFAECLTETQALGRRALETLAQGTGDGVLLTNSLSWERGGEIELTGLPTGAQPDVEGLVGQEFEDLDGVSKLAVTGLHLPSLGYQVASLAPLAAPPASAPFVVTEDAVETPFAKVRFDDYGRIVSFYDVASRRELVTKGGAFNAFLMGEDVPQAWDNWDIDRDQRLKLAPQTDLVERAVIAEGPLQLRIRQKHQIGGQSWLTQDIVFHATTARVDFDTAVDWKEKYQFLKVGFALDIHADTARHEIQFGHVTRSAHDNTTWDRAQFDVCAHKWTDISENGFGVTFLNDCKYACTIKDGEYRLSLIKSGRHPDPRGDEGRHRFAYALLPHAGGFSIENVVRPAYEFNLPPSATLSSQAGASFSLASVDAQNVIIESVKWAEDGGGFILRLYEAGRTGTHAVVKFGVPVTSVSETNLLEEDPTALEVSEGGVSLYLKAFEIKTLKVTV
ncbi:alpha-mannosidase [Capsulimonas corticalis]|uniref:Alpha-mannosidase n=1 Tax=Capsulimonas corticalis TaxID=2219043 RepID=A0A402CR34_9BACT|nr:glycoside hydrolase family 38 C-terminal domain-containing protein [Capsulimonas corticalis]BDI34524.1 alpha-mannosidase [Capsulimonas corticalis]